MKNQNALSAYQQNSVRGTTPVGQVVALYDTILRDFYRGLAAFESGNTEARIFELNHSITVIAELQSSLNFEKGEAAARRLNNFYELTRVLILKVSVSPSREGFQQLIELFKPVRQAWETINQELPASLPRESTPAVSVSMTSVVQASAPVPQPEAAPTAGIWRG